MATRRPRAETLRRTVAVNDELTLETRDGHANPRFIFVRDGGAPVVWDLTEEETDRLLDLLEAHRQDRERHGGAR